MTPAKTRLSDWTGRVRYLMLLVLTATTMATSLFAADKTDEVWLNNGDHITGEIKKLERGIFYFKPGYALDSIEIDWTLVDPLTLYAEWLPGSTVEAYRAQQRLEAYIEGIFRIEPIDRPDPASQRIIWEGRAYDIKGVVEIDRGDGWELAVTSRGAAEAAAV